jgi:hypothetical protein
MKYLDVAFLIYPLREAVGSILPTSLYGLPGTVTENLKLNVIKDVFLNQYLISVY